MQRRTRFDRTGKVYSDVLQSLKDQKEAKKDAVLNIHIPGTGCQAHDPLPTYNALFEFALMSTHAPAILYFQGTGYGGDNTDYVSPALNDPNTLEARRKETSIFNMSLGSSSSDLDLIVQDDLSALALGIIGGAGKKSNNERIMGALEALEEDEALPDVIFLSGHSRGAINCISVANEIYEKYHNKIKVHLLLTDPVPGPMYGNAYDTLIIPENVVSFTCFYAADEDRLFFIAHDHERLKFRSPHTTITSYPMKGNHNTFFRALRPCQPYMDQIVYAINGENIPELESNNNIKKFDKTVSGKGYREGSVFHMITPISSECSEDLGNILNQLRDDIGDDNFDIKLINIWRDKQSSFSKDIQEQVCKNLDFNFTYSKQSFQMTSDEVQLSIKDEIGELLEIASAVLTETELSILLDKDNYNSIVHEIAGSLTTSKSFNVIDGAGIEMSGLTEIYFKNLEKNSKDLALTGIFDFLKFDAKSDKVTCVSDKLHDNKEKRKKDFFLHIFETLAKYGTSEQIKCLKKENEILVSNRMRLLRYDRPLIGKESKIPAYIDSTSYKAYLKTVERLEAEKLDTNEKTNADIQNFSNPTENIKLLSKKGNLAETTETKQQDSKQWLIDALKNIDVNAFGHLHKGLQKINEISKSPKPDNINQAAWTSCQIMDIIERCQSRTSIWSITSHYSFFVGNKRAPEVDLLYRSIAKLDENIKSSLSPISTLEELIKEQQKREAAILFKNDRQRLLAIEPDANEPDEKLNQKIVAYQILIHKINDRENADLSLQEILDECLDDSSLIDPTIRKRLEEKRGFTNWKSTSEKTLDKVLNSELCLCKEPAEIINKLFPKKLKYTK